MSQLNAVREVVERMLALGIEDRDAIVAVARQEIDVDEDELLNTYFAKAVSFAITHIRDDFGRRLVYQIRDNGKRLAVDVRNASSPMLVRKIGTQKIVKAKAELLDGYRLIAIADQLELQFPNAA